ncbi:MAG: aminomethyl-transferring glycine dehydrogenase subunit GcvPB [Nitrospirae bacterium]|nr:aminomethyl-transferring glycine dehydrogenase subunit GcvPB [Nitrospirota bacterium]
MEEMPEKLIFEKGAPGRRAYSLPDLDVPEAKLQDLLPREIIADRPLSLPEVSEIELIRHFTNLSRLNYGVDLGFYPLGSCTMKYNPKVNEEAAKTPGLMNAHPLQPEGLSQGALRLLYELEAFLKEIGGVARVSLQPVAGAHGELTGLLVIRAYHEAHGNPRHKVIIPDSAHGTNPASAALAGYEPIVIKSTKEGLVDVEELKKVLDTDCAALMLTNPNTLGLFEKDILEISRLAHDAGVLLYMDGANLNALLGIVRPGDMGFDVVHFNLHKTFSTPHGGGGPGAGPIGVTEKLAPFIPVPTIEKEGDRYSLDHNRPHSIGSVHGFYGNFGILVRAYAYIRRLGAKGLREVSENAVLNANYIKKRLRDHYYILNNVPCMHECVFSAKYQKTKGVHAWDITKRLQDYGFHPPTVNFPLIIDEAIMIEPTETESRETLDAFCDAMIAIAKEAETDPDLVKNAPHTRVVRRLDEAMAVKKPNLRWQK